MKQEFLVFVQCAPGSTYDVGLSIAKRAIPIVTQISSVSGDWDLLIRVVIEGGLDVGQELARIFSGEEAVLRTNTIAAFPIIDPSTVYFSEDGDA